MTTDALVKHPNPSFGLGLSKPVLRVVEPHFDWRRANVANRASGSDKTWLARGSPHTCWPCTGPPTLGMAVIGRVLEAHTCWPCTGPPTLQPAQDRSTNNFGNCIQGEKHEYRND